MNTVHRFCLDEEGQDLVEYTLLLALITLTTIAIMQQTGFSVQPIWAAGSVTLQSAAQQGVVQQQAS